MMWVFGRWLRFSSLSAFSTPSLCLPRSHPSVFALAPSSSSSPSRVSPSPASSPSAARESRSLVFSLSAASSTFATSSRASRPASRRCSSTFPTSVSAASAASSSESSSSSASFSTCSPSSPFSFVGKTRGAAVAAAALRSSRRPGIPTTCSTISTSTISTSTSIGSRSFSNRSQDRCSCSSSSRSGSRRYYLRAREQSLKSHHLLSSGVHHRDPVLSWSGSWRGTAGAPHGGTHSDKANGPEGSAGGSTPGEGELKGAAPETRAPDNPAKQNIFSELYENPWTVPNALCVTRIALAPVIACFVSAEEFGLALGLLSLAGITDLLDGFIARTWPSQQSALGSALDPLADKILISVLYVSLTCAHLIPVPLTALIISRDIALIGAVFYVRYRTVPPPVTLARYFNPRFATAQLKPTLISKVNTAVQLFLVAASLTAPVLHYTDSSLLVALWYVTAFTTAGSGYSYYRYGRQTVRVLNETK